jgi:hypothetical protein
LGRLLWGLVVLVPLAGFVVVLLMLSAEIRGLDHSKTVLNAADSLLTEAMLSKSPESVPDAIRHLSGSTNTTVVLLRNDGSSAYSDLRVLNRLKTYTLIPEEWRKSIHSPDLFLWPSSALPGRLSREIDRVYSMKSARLLADNHGQASPLALTGGYAAWIRAIPNKPSCASCHGFDKEVLGHWVAISRVDSVLDRRGTVLWGFWPLPLFNQTFLFASVAGLAVFAVLLVSVMETLSIRRGYRALAATKKKVPGKKEGPGKDEAGTGEDGVSVGAPDPSPRGEWEDLHQRIDRLDHSILALIDEIPRAGVLPRPPEEDLSVQNSLSDLLSEWSDRFEMALQELESHPACASDPLLSRFIAKAREAREKAVSYVDIAAAETPEKTYGLLKAPFFEVLSEDQKDWTDRLRAVLGHLHAEVRAMGGVSREEVAKTDAEKVSVEAPKTERAATKKPG